jgi:hypothetical protein
MVVIENGSNRWAVIAALTALCVVLLIESVLVAESLPGRYSDRDPPSRWSQTVKDLFGRP